MFSARSLLARGCSQKPTLMTGLWKVHLYQGLRSTRHNLPGIRFKSDISSMPEITEVINSVSSDVAESVMDATSKAPNAVSLISPDQIGYFQSLGLADSWIWPTGFFQHIFEYAHVYTGLPWWATILVVTIGTRLLMLPLYTSSSDATAKMAHIKPELTEIMERAKTSTNQMDMQRAMMDRRRLLKEHDVKMRNLAKPMFGIPVFFGVFGALNGMSKASVAGFTQEGLGWFQNLSSADPYCGLQIITALTYSFTFKFFGGETGSGTLSPVMQKVFTYMPFIAVPLTMALPSSICFYLAINGAFSVIQSNLLKNATVRKKIGLAPILTPAEQAKYDQIVKKTQTDSIIATLREKYENAKLEAERKIEAEQRSKAAQADFLAARNKQYVQFRNDKSKGQR